MIVFWYWTPQTYYRCWYTIFSFLIWQLFSFYVVKNGIESVFEDIFFIKNFWLAWNSVFNRNLATGTWQQASQQAHLGNSWQKSKHSKMSGKFKILKSKSNLNPFLMWNIYWYFTLKCSKTTSWGTSQFASPNRLAWIVLFICMQ